MSRRSGTDVTDSPSDTLADYASTVADAVGGAVVEASDTVKISVPSAGWVEALTTARDRFGLIFFSWLSAVDWTPTPGIGEPVDGEVEERFEILCTVADISEGRRVTFSTDLPKERASIASLVDVYPGANWHERETAEMFGIEFVGHPNLAHLYLPDGFIGRPLLKSFPLRSRDVKPWPGTVDVEGMPGAADVETTDDAATGDE